MADLLLAARLFGVVLIVLMLCGIVTSLVILYADRDPDDREPPMNEIQTEWRLYMQAQRDGTVNSWDEWKSRKERV